MSRAPLPTEPVTLSEAKGLAGVETLRFAQGDKRRRRWLAGITGFGC